MMVIKEELLKDISRAYLATKSQSDENLRRHGMLAQLVRYLSFKGDLVRPQYENPLCIVCFNPDSNVEGSRMYEVCWDSEKEEWQARLLGSEHKLSTVVWYESFPSFRYLVTGILLHFYFGITTQQADRPALSWCDTETLVLKLS